jgi:diguanylate cyclase
MSNQSDLKKELERWKDKYFEQGESFDGQKKLIQDYASLMQRILVRVSLAAEHTSDELDGELASLRSAVRSATPEKNDLEKRLKRIDKLILAADESKQQNLRKVASALESIIDQLLTLKLPRKQKSGLKKLLKSIAKRSSNIQEYPAILSEYAKLQSEVLSVIVDPDKKEAGFLSRLLGGGSDENASADTASGEDSSLSEEDLELETDDASNAAEELAPGFSSVARHIRNTLSNLLDQLAFPSSATREVAKLRGQIEKELVWYELGPTLDDLSNLILSVVGKGQREFSNFLKVLDERLSKVQDFLVESQSIDDSWQDKNEKFDQHMRDQVDEMTQRVGKAVDIDDLKRSISEHLDSISSAVDQHAGDAVEHQQAKEEEVEVLKERIKAMEEETRYIRKRLKEERDKALKDSLTSLPNREAYDERFELELERYKRYKKPATLVVADIDFFKSINDNYGHLSGDKVLQIIAKEIQNRIRKTDFVARYGGEEFVIILPETDLQTAKQVIEKVREMIGRLPFHFRDEKIQITMSFGLSVFEEGLDQGQLFERADSALYQAKENGRNRAEVWSEASSD